MSTPPRDALTLAALATVALPGLEAVAAWDPTDPGDDCDVAGVQDADGNRWIIRAPRFDAAGAAMEGEVELLHALAAEHDESRLIPDVPRPAAFAPLPEGGRAMVYPEIAGGALPVDRLGTGTLAAEVARAIASLHELPEQVVADAGLPVYDAEGYRQRRLTELDEAAGTGHVPARLLRRWEQALEDVRLWRFLATPVHGDLAPEHVLVREGHVVGFIDWSDARVADPADDLAWLLAAAPEGSVEAILDSYSQARSEHADEHLISRAVLASELALARWLMHGVRVRDNEILDDAIAMLAELDEATAGAAPIGAAEPDDTIDAQHAVEADRAAEAEAGEHEGGADPEPARSEPSEPEPAAAEHEGDDDAGEPTVRLSPEHPEPAPDDAPPVFPVGEPQAALPVKDPQEDAEPEAMTAPIPTQPHGDDTPTSELPPLR